MSKVALIGGTGFVGRHLVRALVRSSPGSLLTLLSRHSPPESFPSTVRWTKVDVTDGPGLPEALSDSDVVYYLPGILAERRDQTYEEVHYEGVVRTIAALKGRTIRRLVHVSAVGAASDAPSRYHRTKRMAEIAVEQSGLPYTIVRPSLVFGEGDRSINQFLFFGRAFHILPMIGSGKSRVQPVWAGDLAGLLALLSEKESTRGRILEVGGPRIYTYRELMESLRESARLRAVILPSPVWAMMVFGGLQKNLLPAPFLTPDVIRMALSDNVTSKNALVADFGMNLTSLESYLESRSR